MSKNSTEIRSEKQNSHFTIQAWGGSVDIYIGLKNRTEGLDFWVDIFPYYDELYAATTGTKNPVFIYVSVPNVLEMPELRLVSNNAHLFACEGFVDFKANTPEGTLYRATTDC